MDEAERQQEVRRTGSGERDGAWEEGLGMELEGRRGVRERPGRISTEEDFDGMWGIRERAMLSC